MEPSTVLFNNGDTIPGAIDQCPDTPSGETVDELGCSPSQKDTDADGITDDFDKLLGLDDHVSIQESSANPNVVVAIADIGINAN